MLPVKAPTGKPDTLVCTHTATGHNNAVLSMAVTEDILITGSKGNNTLSVFFFFKFKYTGFFYKYTF